MTIAERVKAVRARARIRRWEYRQRNLAHGAWARFRAALAHAREAYAIDDATVAALIAEGFIVDDRGRGLEPPRHIVDLRQQSGRAQYHLCQCNPRDRPRRATRRSRLQAGIRGPATRKKEMTMAEIQKAGSDFMKDQCK